MQTQKKFEKRIEYQVSPFVLITQFMGKSVGNFSIDFLVRA